MNRARKYGGMALLILAILIVVQVGVSFIVKTKPMRAFLTRKVENAFGRPVQVGDFAIQLLPMPQVEMDRVTIAEDPAFGQEYFLRADRMTAGLRWTGLLRGHFQFGTMSLSRPSLILVRNSEGRWNLEDWLPPARGKTSSAQAATGNVVPQRAEATHHLQTIEFDDGRINFKTGEEKRPFAFIGVSGSVEQVSDGRWRLRLEAKPWRSGVLLQSTGTLQVIGDVAGTSARLQPAQIQVHWDKVSLADIFRMVTGNDSGVRGEFALDGKASVGTEAAPAESGVSPWRFQLQARATQLHRWDLTERRDNPRVNINVKGVWDRAHDQARAEEVLVELPASNLAGTAVLQTAAPAAWRAHFEELNIQADDLLAWYRAFQPGMAEQVAVRDSLKGNVSVSGWPLRWEDGALESRGGALFAPGLKESRLEPFRATLRNGKFVLDGLKVRLGADAASQTGKTKVASPEDSLEFALNEDTAARQGSLRMNLRLPDAARLFKLTSAFGRRLDQGWEYDGGAAGVMAWNWGGTLGVQRSGSVELTRSRLAIVGLNLPLKIEQSRVEWKDGRHSATIGKVDAFGANWSGTISQVADAGAGDDAANRWRFELHADRLDAAELDRWFGPRARPNWVQRLMTSLLGETASTARASDFVRRVSAQGELTADSVTIEKIKLLKARADVEFRDLKLRVTNAEAQWAGGNVQGQVAAVFSPVPQYEVTAQVDRANLAQLPWASRWAERWGGTASGTMQLSTSGVGREELLRQLSGEGDVRLSKVELRGWDVRASTESGVARAGTSRWVSGAGKFSIGEQQVTFQAIQLDGPQAHTELSGTLGFDMSGRVMFFPGPDAPGTRVVQASRGLSLSGPFETPKAVVQTVSEETTRP